MGSPYRTAPTARAADAPRDAGIVGDIIDQFADKFAFLRELVQNAIDAGTHEIEVTIGYDSTEEIVRVAVRDAGEGMSRDIIENGLLVLFRSTKENDPDKIGKFGVGFASVLAIEPRLVRVTSSHGGERHALHLFRDLSYELFDLGRATRTGTIVELEIPLVKDRLEGFEKSCRAALTAWCCHASVPIVARGIGERGADRWRDRVERPLALDNPLLEVRHEQDGRTAVVGLRSDYQISCGFFNHGLTLFRSERPLLGNFSFKVQDGRLGHTLSRDNVRRDHHFDRALEFVNKLARDRLPAAHRRAMADAAERGDRDRYKALARAARANPDLLFDRSAFVVPVLSADGRRGNRAVSSLGACARAGLWAALAPDPVTDHMALAGAPVIDLDAGGRAFEDEFVELLSFGAGEPVRRTTDELTLVRRVAHSAVSGSLCDRVLELLDRAHRAPAGLAMAEFHGMCAALPHIAGGARDAYQPRGSTAVKDEWLVRGDATSLDPMRLFSRKPLALNARSAEVDSVLALAKTEFELAAQLLARLVLFQFGRLDVDRSDSLTEIGIAALLEGKT